DYVPGPEHADDEIVADDQPYAEDASPNAQSPEYVPESDLEPHPKDDDDEDPEEDPVGYPADGGDDGDDEDGSSEDDVDDEDDDMDIEANEEEEEEHPAPADFVVVALTAADQAPFTEETEPFETDESAATPPPHPAYSSPLSPWSSPPPQIPFPPLPPILSPPSLVLSPAPPPSPIRSLGYRVAMIRLRAKAASTSSPPLQPPSASRRKDRPEVTLPPQKRLGIALGPRYEVGESSSAAAARSARGLRADYGFVAIMDREIMHDPEREVGYGITDSWDEIVEALDRCAHTYTRHLMETEARISREAWVRSTYASDLVRGEVMSLRTTVFGQMTEIRELHAADRRRQTVISELLRTDHKRSTEITELRTSLQG
nr:hypothetical protein [Tanacetum cinerariifolium]